MNRFLALILCCICFIGHPTTSVAQHEISLRSIPIQEELPSLNINKIFQDHDGYMWFATNEGIGRYDAYGVHTFSFAEANKNILNQHIISVAEIRNTILVGGEKGLFTIDKKTYRVAPFPDKRMKQERIKDIFISRDSSIWVGTLTGIYIYHADFTLRKEYQNKAGQKNFIPPGGVNSFFEDVRGDMWVTLWESGIHKLDKKNNRFISYPTIGGRNNPYKMFQDNRGQLWVCTWGDGLFLFHPTRTGKDMYVDMSLKNKRRKTGKEYLYYNILQDKSKQYIWALSFSGLSAFRYNMDGSLEEVNMDHIFRHTTNNFGDVYSDRDGLLWISSPGEGISILDFTKSKIPSLPLTAIKDSYSLSPNLTMLFKDSQGRFWFNQERIGLGMLEPQTNAVTTYSNADFSDLISLRAVSCMVERNQELWIGSSHESYVNVFKSQGNKLTLLRSIDLKPIDPQIGTPLSFLKDEANNLWIATTNGLLLKTAQTNHFRSFPAIREHVTGMATDGFRYLWIATQNSGIFKLDIQRGVVVDRLNTKTSGLGTNEIETIAMDHRRRLWIATRDKRLLAYHVDHKTSKEYANALLFVNDRLLNIIPLQEDIWLSTTRNIYKVVPKDSAIFEYASTDGLPVNMFAKEAYFLDKKQQNIYFGGGNGVAIFSNTPSPTTYRSSVLISDIKVNNVSVINTTGKPLFDFASNALTLPPDAQNVEINYSTLNYKHAHKIRFAYKLVGVDKDWIYPPKERAFATYNNLSKGSYKFLIKATDVDNIWGEHITTISIEKLPAFYESSLAYILYAFTSLLALSYAIYFAMNRVRLRSELRIVQIQKDNAEELVQTKLSYFTNISHELLTPLTIISCLIDDLETSTTPGKTPLHKIRLNVQRLKRLLQQVLDFRKVESKQMELHVGKHNLSQFVHNICTTYFQPLAERKGISFSFTETTDLSEAYYDQDKVDKILFNILSNAFKYTLPKGTITVETSLSKQEKEQFCVIKIQDTGKGIAAQDLDKIFIPFFNSRNSRNEESNGIGLSLSQALATLHHGKIQVDSTVGKGSCFQFIFPINESAYRADEMEHPTPLRDEFLSTIPISTPSLSEQPLRADLTEGTTVMAQLHLLLVDDNEDLIQTMRNVLSRNYVVSTASDGKQALAILRKQEIDIVVSDIMMPEMDGFTLCKTLKTDMELSHVPVILLTAKRQVEDRIDAYNMGADAYISKPFELKELEAQINSFVINKRTKQVQFKQNSEINISNVAYTSLDEKFLQNAIKIVEEHLSNSEFEVMLLAQNLHMSKSTLYRKVKSLLNLSPNELIKNIRLKHACQLLDKDSSISVTEVAFATGFSDPRYFATCFKAEFGQTPSDYQRKAIQVLPQE